MKNKIELLWLVALIVMFGIFAIAQAKTEYDGSKSGIEFIGWDEPNLYPSGSKGSVIGLAKFYDYDTGVTCYVVTDRAVSCVVTPPPINKTAKVTNAPPVKAR